MPLTRAFPPLAAWLIAASPPQVSAPITYPEGPYLSRPIDQLRKDVEAEFLAATRTPSGIARSGRVDNVAAAAVVSAEAWPSKGYAVVIENLRDVPIEAVGLANVDPVTGQDKGGMRTAVSAAHTARLRIAK
ncbi:MAG TPA: hypothetical protein VFZ98_13105 [Vicinamibacterales bacterium]